MEDPSQRRNHPMERLCNKILGLDNRILSVIITDRSNGNILAVKLSPEAESMSQYKTSLISMYERILRGLTSRVGEAYGTCNFMVFSFSQAHAIIMLLEKIVVIANAKPEVALDVIPKIKKTAEEYMLTVPSI